MSPGMWSPIPRSKGPELLARWEQLNGYWRLAVYDRVWQVADSVYTNIAVSEPKPGDHWLERLGFIPVGDSEWADNEGRWERDVARGPDTPGTSDT